MNIGVDTGSATLAGVGVAPSPKDGAAPGASSREAAHFQSLVDGRTSAGRRDAVREPASRDGGRLKPPVRGGASPAAKPATAATATAAATTSPTETAPDGVNARPTAARSETAEEPAPETPAADEAPSDSALLAALAAMFAAPAPAPATVPAASVPDAQGDPVIAANDTPAPAAVAIATNTAVDEAITDPTAAPLDAATLAAAVAAETTAFDIPADVNTVTPRPDAQPEMRPAKQESQPAVVAPVPSAAARALARALGAMAGETAGTSAAPAVAKAAGPVETPAAAELPESDLATAAAATGKRPAATKGTAPQLTAQVFGATISQTSAEPSAVSVEGALRKASVAAQGRELAAAAAPRVTEVTAPQSLGASILDASARVEGIAVQAAQGGQQASIGLAPAITDNGLGREGTVAEQLVKAVRLQVRDGIGEARLTLRPDHMGEVTVQLKIDKDRVSATLVVERADVRAQIEGQGAALRAGLEAQGLKLEEFVVREDAERRKGSGQEGQREQSGRRRRQASDKSFDLDDA